MRADNQALAIALMGPTASGKSDLAMALCEALDGEIVSVDSALVYRGLDIGAAKPSAAERARVVHHLIDIRDPAEPYSAADFCRDAAALLEDIVARGKVPVLAGGTMLYFKALLEGLSPMPEADAGIRRQIEEEAASHGWPALHRQLAEVDPEAAARIHPNHSQRLSRALEVYRISGRPLSSFQQSSVGGLLEQYRWCQLALAPRQRAALHVRIEQRFAQMLAAGFVGEVERLRARSDLHLDLPAMRAVGYRQVWEHLDGRYDHATLIEKGVAATRQLAKRQLTWLRSWTGLQWLDTLDDAGHWRETTELNRIALKIVPGRAI